MTAPVSYAFTDACTACGACLLTCPEHAIVAALPLQVREDRCTGCGECVEVCPADAVVELSAPVPARVPADHGGVARSASVLSVAGVPQLHDRVAPADAGGAGGAAGAAGSGSAR